MNAVGLTQRTRDAARPVRIPRWEPSELDGKTVAYRLHRNSSGTARGFRFGILIASGTREEAIVMISPDAGDEEAPHYVLNLEQEAVDRIQEAPERLGCAFVCGS